MMIWMKTFILQHKVKILMIKELKDKTQKLAIKIAVSSNTISDKKDIKSMTDDLKNTYTKIYQSKIKGNGNSVINKSYKKNLQAFAEKKTSNLVKEIHSLDKPAILTDVKSALEGINNRYNKDWLQSELDVIDARLYNNKNFDNYLEAQKDDENAVVTWICEADACEECLPFDGMTAPPDDSVWDDIQPGEIHPNCRCYTELSYDKQATEIPDLPDDIFTEPLSSGKIFKI